MLEQRQTHGGEAGSFSVRDVLKRQAVLFEPDPPLPDAGSRSLGAVKPRRAPVDRVPGQQVDDMSRRGVQRLRDLSDGEVTDRYGPADPGRGDAVRIRPRQLQTAHGGGVESRGPLGGFVDAAFVEGRACGVGEQFGLGGQDAPAESLVLLALGLALTV
ncbi:hypothetical protein [Streptomyces acidicola]|uniref:hypothetical protein n=1 Tax=Streptomyces acidicola TaxID=2596892 RepID=UPI003810FFCC